MLLLLFEVKLYITRLGQNTFQLLHAGGVRCNLVAAREQKQGLRDTTGDFSLSLLHR